MALTAKGVDMTDVPFTQYHDRIASITTGGSGGSNGEWIRPADRPPVPTIGENEQVIYWLFGVQQDSPNDYAIMLSTSAAIDLSKSTTATGGTVYVRRGPGTGYKDLGIVKSGDKHEASGEAADGWYGLIYKGEKAWISAKYAEIVK